MLPTRVLLVLVLAAPLSRADVLVVDALGGGDFTLLSAAVAAAADGEGEAGTLDLGGAPTDTTLLFASLDLGQLAMPGHQGVFVLSPAALIGPFVIGPPGNQSLHSVAPSLPAGLDVVHLHLQPAYVGGSGVRLGPGAMLTLLDAAFSF
ncbi:MAG TPA: hypothetical protein VFD43_08640 [Planctomycetota bacterium]|nr:hypothetical protein [Planctomycetota bacterium]